MAWSSILGHEDAVGRLRESIARGRLSHAYLFVGPDGVGKALVARELAKTLLCDREADAACDACGPCRKVAHGNHPDVTVLGRIERTAKGQRKTRIVIDQVREEIQGPIAYKPFEGRWKVYVVEDAGRMSEAAQNCLLKTLEEPPPHSLLILVADRLEPFVDTVVSRCQVVRFRPLAAEQVEAILAARAELESAQAAVLARLSEGSPGRALGYHEAGTYETACWLLEELGSMPAAGGFVLAGDLLDRAKEKGSRLEDARVALRPVLELLTLAWRDLLVRASGYSESLLVWGDASPALLALGEGLSATQARRLVERTLAARDQLDANANIKLLLETLILDLREALRGRLHTVPR
ncbi:MAG: DNA polymerase III subunit delta' [bacterium]